LCQKRERDREREREKGRHREREGEGQERGREDKNERTRMREPVTALTNGDVQDQFIDHDFAHDIVLAVPLPSSPTHGQQLTHTVPF
jgi:hypothetical protein